MARITPTHTTTTRSAIGRAVAAIVAVALLAGGLVAPSAGAAENTPSADELQRLQQVQIGHLEMLGVTTDHLAARVRRHLGLPAEGMGELPDDCAMVSMEHGAGHHDPAVQNPEVALAALIDDLATNGPAEIRDALTMLHDGGGAVRWDAERIDASGYVAIQTTRNLHVGTDWLAAANADVRAAHANIAHEVGGHLFYGAPLSCRILVQALGDDERLDREELFFAMAYPESEIYSELKELPFASEANMGDAPEADVAARITQIRAEFPTGVAEVLLWAMGARFAADPTLTPEAIELFEELVGA